MSCSPCDRRIYDMTAYIRSINGETTDRSTQTQPIQQQSKGQQIDQQKMYEIKASHNIKQTVTDYFKTCDLFKSIMVMIALMVIYKLSAIDNTMNNKFTVIDTKLSAMDNTLNQVNDQVRSNNISIQNMNNSIQSNTNSIQQLTNLMMQQLQSRMDQKFEQFKFEQNKEKNKSFDKLIHSLHKLDAYRDELVFSWHHSEYE